MNKSNHLNWLDNLRTTTIFLVVLYHVGGVYEGAGLWASFWIVDDPNTLTWVGIVGIIFDIMVMPIMFFVSGYLTPGSISGKTSGLFLKRKAQRLLIPWLLAVFTLIPIYRIIFLYSRHLPQESWLNYFHFTSPNSQNWLWFLPVLYLFNLLYLLMHRMKISVSHVSINSAIAGIFILGFTASLGVGSLLGFRSWTLTALLDFENERLVLYFMMFLFGALCFEKGVFEKAPQSKKLYIFISSIAWIPVTAHIFVRLVPFFYENFAVTLAYRSWWWLSFNLSLLVLLYTMIESFRLYFDKPGKMWAELNKNAYGVYIIHVIMIGMFGTILLQFNISGLIKYPALIMLTYGFSNLLVSLRRRLF